MNIPVNNSYIEIDIAAIRENAAAIAESLPASCGIIPVLKDDGYGLGSVRIAQALEDISEVMCIAVAHVSEGLELRAAGIKKPILVMANALPFQLEAALKNDLTLTCGRPGIVSEIADTAKKLDKTAAVHIKIDTGLHRIGMEPGDELERVINELRLHADSVKVCGVFSHFSDAFDHARCRREFECFNHALTQLRSAGIDTGVHHISCSASSELYPEFYMDAVRIGRRLYMDNPQEPLGNIREAVSWNTYITALHERRAGDRIGYGEGKILEKDCRIATIGVGYGDGLNKKLADVEAPVLVNGRGCRLLNCCMDQSMIDVSDVDCRVGDTVTFFGHNGGDCISSQWLAELINADEGCGLTSALSDRVARIYK